MPSNAATDPRHDFLPAREADLVAWSRCFRDKIVADPIAFGLTAAQAAAYAVLHDAFAAAYADAVNPSANCRSAIMTKNDAKRALKAEARRLARIVRAAPSVTLTQRLDLGLTCFDADHRFRAECRIRGIAYPVPARREDHSRIVDTVHGADEVRDAPRKPRSIRALAGAG